MNASSNTMSPVAVRCWQVSIVLVFGHLMGSAVPASAAKPSVEFDRSPGQLAILVGGNRVATYVFRDDQISRPYFANVHAPGGVLVTRKHPPVAGTDPVDHATYHPGIWLAFGDINGSDYWRLAAPVRHDRFVKEPAGGAGRGSFAVRNTYLSQADPTEIVCAEICRITFEVCPDAFRIKWDSTFSSEKEFYFGDQEEMGLGFRIASPMYVKPKKDPTLPNGTGQILDAEGRTNEKQIWGNAAKWCDYHGRIGKTPAGIAILCHPSNFRPSWFHARDYGVLVANPFGREAMRKGSKSKIVVKPGESLRLRYGLLLHSGKAMGPADLNAAYEDYVNAANQRK